MLTGKRTIQFVSTGFVLNCRCLFRRCLARRAPLDIILDGYLVGSANAFTLILPNYLLKMTAFSECGRLSFNNASVIDILRIIK